MSGDNRGPDDSRPAITLARLAAIVTAATSATLGVLKLTGGTMSGAIALGGFAPTGGGQADAAGKLLRYEALGTGTLPTTATFATAYDPLNITINSYTASDLGVSLAVSTATASNRLASRTTAGSRIAARVGCAAHNVGTVISGGGAGVCLVRADGQVIYWGYDTFTKLVLYRLINLNGGITVLVAAVHTSSVPDGSWLRLGEVAGSVVAEWSNDGVNWSTAYSVADATAWGSATVGVEVGLSCYTVTNGTTVSVLARRVTVTP